MKRFIGVSSALLEQGRGCADLAELAPRAAGRVIEAPRS